MDPKKTGILIARLRKEKGLTQTALAEKLNISNRTVSKWENGDGYPDISLLFDIAQLFDVSIDEILSGELAEKNSEKEDAPILFEGYAKPTKDLYKDIFKAFEFFNVYDKRPIFLTAFLYDMLMWFLIETNNLSAHSKELYILFTVFVNLLFLVFFINIKLNPRKQLLNYKLLNGDKYCDTHYVISDKFYFSDRYRTWAIPFSDIKDVKEEKNSFVFRYGEAAAFEIPKSIISEEKLDEFKEFAQQFSLPSDSVKSIKSIKRITSYVMLIIGILMIPLNVYITAENNNSFTYKDINSKCEYYYDNKDDFNSLKNKVQSDPELIKKAEEKYTDVYDSVSKYTDLTFVNGIYLTKDGYVCVENY